MIYILNNNKDNNTNKISGNCGNIIYSKINKHCITNFITYYLFYYKLLVLLFINYIFLFKVIYFIKHYLFYYPLSIL